MKVLSGILTAGIDQQRTPSGVDREDLPLLVAIAEGAGEQVVVPVEGTQRGTAQRLEVVDVRALVVAAVHAPLDAGGHLRQGLTQHGVDVTPYGGVLPQASGTVHRFPGLAYLLCVGGHTPTCLLRQTGSLNPDHEGHSSSARSRSRAATSSTRAAGELTNFRFNSRYRLRCSSLARPRSTLISSATSSLRFRSAFSE